MYVSAVDLFCGAGGLTHGLEQAGISVEAGFDVDSDCLFPYEKNNGATFFRRISVGSLERNRRRYPITLTMMRTLPCWLGVHLASPSRR